MGVCSQQKQQAVQSLGENGRSRPQLTVVEVLGVGQSGARGTHPISLLQSRS